MPESTPTPSPEILEPQQAPSFGESEERFARPAGWDDEEHQTLEQPAEEIPDGEEPPENPDEKPQFDGITFDFHGIPVEIKSVDDLIAREDAFQRSRSMQADYTRKTQALAQERTQLSEIRQLVEQFPDVRQYMLLRAQGIDPQRAMSAMALPPEPEQFVTHPETGQIVPNPEWILHQMQKAQQGQQPVQPQGNRELSQARASVETANVQSGQMAKQMIETTYGMNFTRPISSQGRIFMPEEIVDTIADTLGAMGVDPNGVASPQQIVAAFERSFPDVVEHARKTREAKELIKKNPRPGVIPPKRQNGWLPQQAKASMGGSPDELL